MPYNVEYERERLARYDEIVGMIKHNKRLYDFLDKSNCDLQLHDHMIERANTFFGSIKMTENIKFAIKESLQNKITELEEKLFEF